MKVVPARLRYTLALVATIAVGLSTIVLRRIAPIVSGPLGDTLSTLAVYLLLRVIRPETRPRSVGIVAWVYSALIEFSQLAHPSWLVDVRRTVPGRLLLGWGFDIWDLFWYGVGAVAGVALDRVAWFSARSKPARLEPDADTAAFANRSPP